ncbi:uncharacterized protein UTRI_06162_B [Ustilago trichophora]|uniref:Uncharacterized protein n=1 Tax=Ustilago trichophora TaxID=86804 RepID=A0A5C3EJQ9_9BASI|nr:uncharacterized protein UTRI_06162_B [Ustilago trichophora]
MSRVISDARYSSPRSSPASKAATRATHIYASASRSAEESSRAYPEAEYESSKDTLRSHLPPAALSTAALSSTPPRSLSDPFAHAGVAFQPSPNISTKYGARRASWAPASSSGIKEGPGGYDDPLRQFAGKKVAYGPGFYIPPPGYLASSLGMVYDNEGAPGSGKSQGEVGAAAKSPHYRMQDGPLVRERNGEQVNVMDGVRQAGRQSRARCSPLTATQRASPSSSGTLVIWAILAILLAGIQTLMLEKYESKQSKMCISLSNAALCLELYSVWIGVVGILGSTSLCRSPSEGYSAASPSRHNKKSFTSSMLDSLPSICGLTICLGAIIQLVALITSAVQSQESSTRYSVIISILFALVSTSIIILKSLHTNGHLCSSSSSFNNNNNNNNNNTGRCKHNSRTTLPISEHRKPPKAQPASRQSSISSHGGKYVPDYGLDSDTDSDDDNPRAKRPRADWTDQVLDGLIRSPLLDMPNHF